MSSEGDMGGGGGSVVDDGCDGDGDGRRLG